MSIVAEDTAHQRTLEVPRTRTAPASRPFAPAERELLHRIFEKRADAQPNAIAVASGDERISYLELEQRANRIARRLRTLGVRRGSRVGLLLPRSADAYAAMLGILKAGGAYV